jgi:hypothetical protein
VSGRDGNRGYLVQTVIALLDALQSTDWHTITLEPKHESEKVDILFEGVAVSTRMQVKSSSRQIGKRDVRRWAKELEENVVDDGLELVLVGSCSQSVLSLREIGRVQVRPAKNLDWKGLLREAAHLLDVFLQTEHLESESPQHRELLVNALIAKLSVFASEYRPLKRSEFVAMLNSWLRATDSPPKQKKSVSALSPMPRSCRPDYGAGLIGRNEQLLWLQQTAGDKLISAQPGMGKTFLLQQYARQAHALFLTGTDDDLIADAVTRLQPAAVLIEDGMLYLDSIQFLLSYRRDHNLSFQIIVDSWPGDVDQISTMLGITSSRILSLPELGEDKIVEIVKASGIHGPNQLLHMIVHQASGCPGRAIMLVDACLQKSRADWDDVWTGEKLASWIRACFSGRIGESSIEVLACFSLGGADGATVSAVASILQRPEPEVRRTVYNLALGGLIVEFGDGRLIVVPELLRGILVRDVFFNSVASISISDAVHKIGLSAGLVRSIIAAHARGARISDSELRKWVLKVDSEAVWRDFAYSSSEHADWILHNRPQRIRRLSDVLLQSSPENTIPLMLEQAAGDTRLEHQTPDHPIRRIRDWVQSGFPGQDAVRRRRIALDAFRIFLARGGDINLAALLIPIIVSPQFDHTEQNPADRNQFTMRRGGLLPDDLLQVETFWREILDSLQERRLSDWKHVLSAFAEWVSPHFGMAGVSKEQLAVMSSAAAPVLTQVLKLACDRPGVITTLRQLAGRRKLPVEVHIDETFALLFPSRQREEMDWSSKELERLGKHAVATGKEWCGNSPADLIRKVEWCITESKQMLHPWPDYCKLVVDSIAEHAATTIPWIDAIISQKARPNLVTHFLVTALRRNEGGALERLRVLLHDDHFRYEAVQVALVCDVPDEIRRAALALCVHVPELVDRIAMMNHLTDETIEGLLTHYDGEVVSQALRGLWHAKEKHPIPVLLRQKWIEAATRHLSDEWCLQQALETDQEFRMAWLEQQCRNTNQSSPYVQWKHFENAAAHLTEQMRTELLGKVNSDARHAEALIKALVADSAKVYSRLFEIAELRQFRDSALARTPGDAWTSLVEVAENHGMCHEDIAYASRRHFTTDYAEMPDKYHREIGIWKLLTTHKLPTISRVAKLALKLAEADLERWHVNEQRGRIR